MNESDMREEEPFVKKEYLEGADSKQPKEDNLVRQIEGNTKNLMQALNSIENITNGLNKGLLPSQAKSEANKGEVKRQPQGWLENHLADLEFALSRATQIHSQVARLKQITRIEK